MVIKKAFSEAMKNPKMRIEFLIMVVGCIGAFLIPVVLKFNKEIMTACLIIVAFIVYITGNNFSSKFALYVDWAEKNKK